MSHRLDKIQSTLQRAIQSVLAHGLHDPRAGGLITVTRVDVSPDLANAIVWISVLPEEKQNLTMHAIRHASRHIRHDASDLMDLNKMPQLDFRLDTSLKKQAEVYQALAKARAETPPEPDVHAADAADDIQGHGKEPKA